MQELGLSILIIISLHVSVQLFFFPYRKYTWPVKIFILFASCLSGMETLLQQSTDEHPGGRASSEGNGYFPASHILLGFSLRRGISGRGSCQYKSNWAVQTERRTRDCELQRQIASL